MKTKNLWHVLQVLTYRITSEANWPDVHLRHWPQTRSEILTHAKVNFDKKVKDWNDEESNAIRAYIAEKFRIEGCPSFGSTAEHQASDGHPVHTGVLRHRRGLPVRGQKTKNNAKYPER